MTINLKEKFLKSVSDEIKNDILNVSSFADKAGIKIFLIGGIVRDLILDNPIKDVDIVVQADATGFCRSLSKYVDCEIISEQENLHTAKVLFKSGNIMDFASTREEKYTASGTLPVAYNFGCRLSDDVKRRDFTINTLALELTGRDKFSLVDYYNGYDDIKRKKIRILHDNSFIDDPSRIIRALKFKIRLNFEIESETYDLMQNYLNDVNDGMPLERIKNELKQYFSIIDDKTYSLINETNAYRLISDNPILNINFDNFDVVLKFRLFGIDDIWFICIALLIINSDFSLKRLNFNSEELKIINEVRMLISEKHGDNLSNKKIYDMFANLNNMSTAIYYIITGDKTVETFLKELREIEVLITGKDLINLGYTPSVLFGKLFDKILEKKLNGELNTKEEEINFAKCFLTK